MGPLIARTVRTVAEASIRLCNQETRNLINRGETTIAGEEMCDWGKTKIGGDKDVEWESKM